MASEDDVVAPAVTDNHIDADSALLTQSDVVSGENNEPSLSVPTPLNYSEQQVAFSQGPRSSSTSEYEVRWKPSLCSFLSLSCLPRLGCESKYMYGRLVCSCSAER